MINSCNSIKFQKKIILNWGADFHKDNHVQHIFLHSSLVTGLDNWEMEGLSF